MSNNDLLEPPEFASWMHEMSLPGMQVNSSPTEMMQVPSALWMLLRDNDDGIDALIHLAWKGIRSQQSEFPNKPVNYAMYNTLVEMKVNMLVIERLNGSSTAGLGDPHYRRFSAPVPVEEEETRVFAGGENNQHY